MEILLSVCRTRILLQLQVIKRVAEKWKPPLLVTYSEDQLQPLPNSIFFDDDRHEQFDSVDKASLLKRCVHCAVKLCGENHRGTITIKKVQVEFLFRLEEYEKSEKIWRWLLTHAAQTEQIRFTREVAYKLLPS